MSGDERTGGEWDVRECVAPETAAQAPIVGQSAVFPPRSAEDAGATHPLVLLARNPAAAVESRTPAQMRELYLTVDACLEAFVRSDDAAGDAPGAAAQHACCFLLQCAAFLSLHALRPVAGAAVAAAVAIPVIGGQGGGPWLDGRMRMAHAAIGYAASTIDQPPDTYAHVAQTALEAISAYADDVRSARQIRGGIPVRPVS